MKDKMVLPDFTPGIIEIASIQKFSFQKNLADLLKNGLKQDDALKLWKMLQYIRSFETTVLAVALGKLKPFPDFKYNGAAHVSIGQEAVAAGVIAHLTIQDYITSTHRGHGHCFAKGYAALLEMNESQLRQFVEHAPPSVTGATDFQRAVKYHLFQMFAEMYGKEEGYCHGRGGGMHICDLNTGNLGANAIVGGSSAMAVGAALSQQKLKQRNVTVCFLGDGAANNGVTLEAMNMAAMSQFDFGLPVIYVIENNQYGETGQQKGEVTGIEHLAQRGAGFNADAMHAEVVNGQDVLAVYDAAQRAVALAQNGDGPILLECMTYRYEGHSPYDTPKTYREQEEVEAWRQYDPVALFNTAILENELLTVEQLENERKSIGDQVTEAAMCAASGTDPEPDTIAWGLYCDTDSNDIRDDVKTTEFLIDPPYVKHPQSNIMLYRHAVNEALVQEMIRDKRVIVFGEDVAELGGTFRATSNILEIFGRERIFNTPISESCIIGMAAGASMTGLRPVAEIMYIDFILQAMDQLGNQVAKNRYMFGGKATLPLVIRTSIGAGRGYAGQHSQSLEALIAHIPGLKVAIPFSPYDVKGLLKTAIRDDNPVVFLEHQMLYTERGEVPEDDYLIPFGQANVLREGNQVTVIGYSYILTKVLEAVDALHESEKISVEVIDPRTLYPLDEETILRSVRKTGRVLIVQQAVEMCSYAEHLAYRIQAKVFSSLQKPVEVYSAQSVPPPMARSLELANHPTVEGIQGKILALFR